jgi:hypothetical protein
MVVIVYVKSSPEQNSCHMSAGEQPAGQEREPRRLDWYLLSAGWVGLRGAPRCRMFGALIW